MYDGVNFAWADWDLNLKITFSVAGSWDVYLSGFKLRWMRMNNRWAEFSKIIKVDRQSQVAPLEKPLAQFFHLLLYWQAIDRPTCIRRDEFDNTKFINNLLGMSRSNNPQKWEERKRSQRIGPIHLPSVDLYLLTTTHKSASSAIIQDSGYLFLMTR